MSKPDFLKECISDPALVEPGQPVPLDAFTKAYCVRCDNRQCARAGSNNMLFDRRVQNWQRDLFVSPPRADEADPRFAQIRAKNFAPSGTRLDVPGSPNFVTVAAQPPAPAPPPADPPASPEPASPEPAAVQSPPEAPSAAVPPATIPAVYSRTGQGNTPFQQGAVLPGAPAEAPRESVVQPGGTFTFGDDE